MSHALQWKQLLLITQKRGGKHFIEFIKKTLKYQLNSEESRPLEYWALSPVHWIVAVTICGTPFWEVIRNSNGSYSLLLGLLFSSIEIRRRRQ